MSCNLTTFVFLRKTYQHYLALSSAFLSSLWWPSSARESREVVSLGLCILKGKAGLLFPTLVSPDLPLISKCITPQVVLAALTMMSRAGQAQVVGEQGMPSPIHFRGKGLLDFCLMLHEQDMESWSSCV